MSEDDWAICIKGAPIMEPLFFYLHMTLNGVVNTLLSVFLCMLIITQSKSPN